MKYTDLPGTDPCLNLAAEQYIFDHLPAHESCLLLWQNDNTIVVGKNQNAAGEINTDYVREHGITVVRRMTGGGTVYHDLGNLNYSFITDAAADETINFARFCAPVVETLHSFGVPAEMSGRNDILIEGRKFSGNAQYIRNHRVLHHGTMMYDSDLSVLSKALKVDPAKISSKGVASVRSRVCNLKEYLPADVTLEAYKARLIACVDAAEKLEPLVLTEEDRAAIRKLREERYANWKWTYGISPAYALKNSLYIPGCGKLEAAMDVKAGCIEALMIYGDFFGAKEIGELTRKLIGCPCSAEGIAACVKDIRLDDYVKGLKTEDLIRLLV